MELEELKPAQCSQELKLRLAELNRIFQGIKKNQENFPPGHLKISQKKTHTEFYHITERGSERGRYIPVKEKALAARLAQKDYDENLIKFTGILKFHSAAQASNIMSYMKSTRRPVAGKYDLLFTLH